MPVYNVEAYLTETIESIIGQTMDFEKNCEIIFVNDSSPDNSEEICLRYKERFPNNIKYFKQKNAGPGAARNRGIDMAEGEYISMVDSDDTISPDTLECVYAFFEKHKDEIDLVSIKQMFFEAREGNHPLNYKFTSDRIIDISKEFDSIQMSITSSFVKTEVLQKRHKFDKNVGRYAEDSKLMGEILLDNPKYGVVSRPTYNYRKRFDQASSLDTTKTDRFWYMETPKRAWLSLFDYAEKKTGAVPKFIQFMAMYDFQWRFKQPVQTALTNEEEKEYKKVLFDLVARIDDDVVMSQRQLSLFHKYFVLSRKNNESVVSAAKKKGRKYFYNDVEIYDDATFEPKVHMEIMECKDKIMTIEGYFDGFLFNDTKLQFFVDDVAYDIEPVERKHRRIEFLGELVSARDCYKVSLPLKAGATIRARAVNGDKKTLELVARRFAHLNQESVFSYRICDDLIIQKYIDRLVIGEYTPLKRPMNELRYWLSLARRLKLQVVKTQYETWRQSVEQRGGVLSGVSIGAFIKELRWTLIPLKSIVWNMYAIIMRTLYFIVKPWFKRPIWIVSDRMMAADDNGEVFFRYLSTRTDVPANVYFALSKKSSEFEGVKKYGKVVNYNGLYYKLLFLLSDKLISSEATDYTINPFKGHLTDFVDLCRFDFVFLQHGIIKDDISGWLNRYSKNIKLFVTSTKPEYQSILDEAYGYDESVVKLTGLPRFDILTNDPKGKLILAPTWRDSLAGDINPVNGHRMYNPNFKKSAYYEFYQGLMSDERIGKALKKHKIKGELFLHPSFQNQIKDFKATDWFEIMKMPFDYPKAKREGNILVTDYSSVAFDFAYLKKPVIYTHFDEDSFYKTHTGGEGYFSYEDDGFGPVVYDYEATVASIISMIESGCVMEKQYVKRVEKFFYKFDKNNSKRVYEAILSLDA
jgi:CDP-glycerol glycerophosphotransferase (TagB/SpsB family)/glycosyltransferase involved in cell wall biosynthesis